MDYQTGGDQKLLAFDDPKVNEYDTKASPLYGNLFIRADNTNKVGKYYITVKSTDAAGNDRIVTNNINVQTYLPAANSDIKLKKDADTSNLKAEDYIGAYLKKYNSVNAPSKDKVKEEINGANKDKNLVTSVADRAKYYPEGTKFEWVKGPDSSKAGEQTAVAKAIIPGKDGNNVEELVNIKVYVTAVSYTHLTLPTICSV